MDFLSVNVHRKLMRGDVVHISEFTYCLECICNPKSTLMHVLLLTRFRKWRPESQPHAAQQGLEEECRPVSSLLRRPQGLESCGSTWG